MWGHSDYSVELSDLFKHTSNASHNAVKLLGFETYMIHIAGERMVDMICNCIAADADNGNGR